jgi:serine/threonine protein kinase/DNA-binding beta-propeller fold protein YncE
MAELAPGSVVAGYRIEAIVGRGGMGVVYRATQLSLDRPVALKAIAPELAGDVMFRERFKRESRLAASIEHPNVIPVYEAGEGDGLLYLTMRYIEGTDLRALIEANGALEPTRGARLVAQVAAALAAAHRRGLMHRDVKPANVLIDAEDEREHAYLTDFGIARHVAATSGLTQTGSVLGTLDYLAPERMADGSGDARADVYALGCVLFQALTGSVPYPRDNEIAKMYAHLNADVPDARELRPTPDALAELAMRAMAKEPDERIQSASELAERLLEAADTRSAPAPATLPARPPIPEAPPTVAAPPTPTTEPAPTEPAPTEPAPTEPVPAEPAPTERAPTERPPPRKWRGVLIAGAAGAAVLIAVVVVLAGGGSDDPDSGSQADQGAQQSSKGADDSAPAPLNPTALAPISVEPGADGVATAGGFAWVANRNLNTVTRVNARSRQVEGNPIPVGTEPDSLAAGLGAMWVTNTSDDSVTRLDLGDGTRLGTHTVGKAPEGIVVAHGAVWVANGADGSVSRLDEEGNELAKADVGEGPVQLAATTDAVWVTVSKENKIVELDRDSGDRTDREVPIPGTPRGIAYEPVRGELWVSASAADQLVVVDPDSAGIEDRVDVPENPREVRYGFGAIWVTSATAQRVSAVDPAERRMIDNIPIRGTTYGLATGEGLVWAASESEGLLLPVRPR